jgi:hypothetical protein
VREPDARQLLTLWEGAQCAHPAQRALILLGVALPQANASECAGLDLGLRDWHLLRLRAEWFGPALPSVAQCPHCDALLDVDLDAEVLLDSPPDTAVPVALLEDGRRFRLPNGGDLVAISAQPDVARAEQALLQRCALDPGDCSDDERLRIDARLAALAAERGRSLILDCENCGAQWSVDFDPALYLWEDIAARAATLLDQVHRLALAYGWREADILDLDPARRAAYLERLH